MDPKLLINAIGKWIHLASAGVLVGSLLYLRFLLIPHLDTLPQAVREAVWPGAYRKTLRWALYALFLLLFTGIDNIMKARKTILWLKAPMLSAYWSVFWFKMAAFAAVFLLVHMMVIGGPAFKRVQQAHRGWLTGLVVLSLAILFFSGLLTLMRLSQIPVR